MTQNHDKFLNFFNELLNLIKYQLPDIDKIYF